MAGEAPKHPYREEKPLTDLIPPDRRRARLIAVMIAGLIVGVALDRAAPFAFRALRNTAASSHDKISPNVLRGPDGPRTIPASETTIVHVWLQGCADCMPAFEAMKQNQAEGGLKLGTPIINVAYGEADAAWAARYGVRDNLVMDSDGSAIVSPLGIGTFTTLVVDRHGAVLHRDRPDRAGYTSRLRAVLGQ